MPVYQVTCRELVYVGRIYEVKAKDQRSAARAVGASQGCVGKCIGEDMKDSYEFVRVEKVCDEHGNDCVDWR